jgi:uncharacterized repeat protein (TIGR01451 family)
MRARQNTKGFIRLDRSLAVVALAVFLGCVCVAPALAAPVWRIDAMSATTVAPGGTLRYIVEARNVGDAATDGSTLKLTATLPAGVTAVSAQAIHLGVGVLAPCKAGDETSPVLGASSVACAAPEVVAAENTVNGSRHTVALFLSVAVDGGASGALRSQFEVSGGGAGSASTVDTTQVGGLPGFGVSAFDGLISSDPGGDLLTQAGGHPYDISTSIDFNSVFNTAPLVSGPYPAEGVKDVFVDLPPGLVGNPTAVTQCTPAQLANSAGLSPQPLCPPTSQVGTTTIRFANPSGNSFFGPFPVFNIVPPPDAPARFGFNVQGTLVILDAHPRGGGDYGLTIASRNVPEALGLTGTTVTFWGVPSDPSHDRERACPGQMAPFFAGPTCASGMPPIAFLRNPTSCNAPGEGLTTSMRMDSWAHPGAFVSSSYTSHLPPGYPLPPSEWGAQQGTDGCEHVPFTPELNGTPAAPARSASPSGFSFNLTVPQVEDPTTIGQSDLRKAVVTLPEGVRVNPSSAQGLGACSEAQIKLHEEGSPSCPGNSKVGTVRIDTPLLSQPLTGSVYLASPNANEFGSLLALYLVVEGSGVVVKLAGHVEADPTTGRLTTTFDDTPQLPFSKMHLELNGGEQAPLSLPATCGTYTTEATLTGWNGKTVQAPSTFTVDRGAGGGVCAALGLAPSFAAGTASSAAGSFSPFALTFGRGDGEQQFNALTFTMPPGVSAKLAGVAECSEAEIAAQKCSDASRIGSVTVGAGGGANPYFLKGNVYLTGPYNGGPFGDVVIVQALAGPFDLGNVLVRGSIHIDPHTAQPTIVSDPLPQFVNNSGIPSDIRRVDVTLDRPGFTFNPTNCTPSSTDGTLTGAQGASAKVSSRFAAAECRSLGFKPSFRVATVAKTSRKNGAALSVTVKPGVGQANIARVDTQVPKGFAVRDSTLNQACTERQFAANPAACPAGSFVGTASARTPILSQPLSGPAIFVSHGGAKFPDLDIVLQGEGVTVILTGATEVKKNLLLSHFDTVPDAPVGSFALSLPEGPHSALAAVGNLCTQVVHGRLLRRKLAMPTTITAQNGTVVRQSTKVSVSGCGRIGKPRKAR